MGKLAKYVKQVSKDIYISGTGKKTKSLGSTSCSHNIQNDIRITKIAPIVILGTQPLVNIKQPHDTM